MTFLFLLEIKLPCVSDKFANKLEEYRKTVINDLHCEFTSDF